MAGDYTSYIVTGGKIKLRGTLFTVTLSKFTGGNTEITLDADHGATVGDTFTVESEAGNITISANLNASAPQLVRQDSLGAVGARGLLGGGKGGNGNPQRSNGTGFGAGTNANNGAGGAGHVNVGGKGVEVTAGGAAYGTAGIAYLIPGSGGGGGYHAVGGAGGGAISLEADRDLVIGAGATISANGGGMSTSTWNSSGGGSGGAIRLKGFNIINNGTISAKGGAKGRSDSRGGDGSDGRVALNYSKNLTQGTIDVGFGGTIALSSSPTVTGTFQCRWSLDRDGQLAGVYSADRL